ncbi:MAG: PAS domain S-box protein [Betaproteobacteria bacterium]|nr:PAS domain S-box protein [Betaproteobacteria bacterium]
MLFPLFPAHRIARVNYAPRALAFAYIFIVVVLLIAERGGSAWVIAFGVLQFIVYPHLVYLHARIAHDSKRAEMNNLLADALLLGAWTAQLSFPLWLSCGLLLGPSLNNAAHGGIRRLGMGLLLFAAGALIWAVLIGASYQPNTGPMVTGFAMAGIVGYVSWIGILVYEQNRRLVRTRSALKSSEEQFRFIAEHEGDLVCVLDTNGRVQYASPSHLSYIEPGAMAPGTEWINLVHAEDRLNARQFLTLLRSTKSSERVQLRMFPSDGNWHIVECLGNPVQDENATTQMIVLVSHDVTAYLRAEIQSQLASP